MAGTIIWSLSVRSVGSDRAAGCWWSDRPVSTRPLLRPVCGWKHGGSGHWPVLNSSLFTTFYLALVALVPLGYTPPLNLIQIHHWDPAPPPNLNIVPAPLLWDDIPSHHTAVRPCSRALAALPVKRVSVERLFSAIRLLLSDLWSRLRQDAVEAKPSLRTNMI